MWALTELNEGNTGSLDSALPLSSDRSNKTEALNLLNTGEHRLEWIKTWERDVSTPTKVLTDARQGIDKYLGLWKQVPPESMFNLTREAARFMEENGLTNLLGIAGDIIRVYLKAEGIQSWTEIVELARDIEAPSWEALKICVEIKGKRYTEILDIWEQVCKDFYKELGSDVAKKFYIIMRSAKRR